jgi:hypothetical protein
MNHLQMLKNSLYLQLYSYLLYVASKTGHWWVYQLAASVIEIQYCMK